MPKNMMFNTLKDVLSDYILWFHFYPTTVYNILIRQRNIKKPRGFSVGPVFVDCSN